MGWQHAIAGGQGNLVAGSFQSPGFETGVQGWQVTRGGHAEFNDIVIRGGTIEGGNALYYSGTPAFGNLVASIAATAGTDAFGNAYLADITSYEDDGHGTGGKVAAQHSGNQVQGLAAASAAGPYLSIGDVTFTSVSLFIDGGAGGVTVTGPSATVQSTLHVTSTSELGDAVLLDAAVTPAAPGSGVKAWGNASGVLALRGGDANVYLAGRRVIAFTGTQTVSSATFTTVTDGTNNFSATVAAAAYKFRVMLVYEPSGTTGNANFELTSPAASSCGATFRFDFNGMTSGVARYDNASGFGNAQVGPTNLAIGTTVFCTLVIEGTAVFSASGALAVKAETAGGSNFVIQKGSFFELEPL